VVAHGEVVDALAERLDDAGALVAVDLRAGEEHGREFTGQQIRVAHPGGHHAHEDLTAPRWLELELLDGELTVSGTQDRC
jgi:hypothetical protein